MTSRVRTFTILICALIALTHTSAWQPDRAIAAAEIDAADADLVEHSGEIFFGRIDIVTSVAEVHKNSGDVSGSLINTEYTVLVSDVLKGKLRPQSIIVVRQDGGALGNRASFHEGDGPLIPGNEYLFFTRFVPGLVAYAITEPASGNVPITSPEQRAELVAYWSQVVEQTDCPFTDVLKLDGVVYARRDWNEDVQYVGRDFVGAGSVSVAIQDTSATGCRTDLMDRSSSLIPIGTKIHELKGYATRFRVAVRLRDGNRYLYEAIWSETAKAGADLLDIRDRVTAMKAERWFECDDTADCDANVIATSDRAQVDHVTEVVLGAPVNPDRVAWRQIPSTWVRLTFTLDDASTVTLWIDRASGYSQSGIRVPVDELVEYLWGS